MQGAIDDSSFVEETLKIYDKIFFQTRLLFYQPVKMKNMKI